jgi:hypothetical protein
MNISHELLAEHSKKQTLRIAAFIGNDKARFKSLVKLLFSSDALIAQRASWAAYTCCRDYPEMALPYLGSLIGNLQKPVHDAVKRNTVGILQYVKIPEKWMGIATDTCFKLLQSIDEAVAVKANAMTVLSNIAKAEPDLAPEIRLVVKEMMPYGKPAVVARGKRVLKELTLIG